MQTDDERTSRRRLSFGDNEPSRPSRPTSASLSTLPFSSVFLNTVNAKSMKRRRVSETTAIPSVPKLNDDPPNIPPKNPARRRPATAGSSTTVQTPSNLPSTTYGAQLSFLPSSGLWTESLVDLRQHGNSTADNQSQPSSSTRPSAISSSISKSKKRPATASGVSSGHSLTPDEASALSDLKSSMRVGASARKYFTTKNGQRHHRYSSKSAPYPRCYQREALDHDTWNHLFFTKLCGSITWHNFDSPPRRVLELGCGTGLWILDAAERWTESSFVGLDLVPIQPDVNLLSDDIKNRVRWEIANFLERLPFQNDSFDFVYMRRIARGVPEDKWAFLLEEVTRVLTPDGAVEIVEEELFFPGGVEPCTCHHPRNANENATNENILSKNENSFIDPTRDYTALEQAYNDMHAARFINLSPVSLLGNILYQYFKDLRSAPPVLVTFPPPESEFTNCALLDAQRPRSATSGSDAGSLGTSTWTSPENSPESSVSGLQDPEKPLPITLDKAAVFRATQPFVMVDRCRMPAKSRGNGSQLPNPNFTFDLQSLTLHLSQSVTDVISCVESIWEYLKKAEGKTDADRANFDLLVKRYTRDMREQIGMRDALRARFDWNVKELPTNNPVATEVHSRPMVFNPTLRIGSMASLPMDSYGTHMGTPQPFTFGGLTSPVSGAPDSMPFPLGNNGGIGPQSEVQTPGILENPRPRSRSEPKDVKGSEDEIVHHQRAASVELARLLPQPTRADTTGSMAVESSHLSPSSSLRSPGLPRMSRCVKVFVAWNSK